MKRFFLIAFLASGALAGAQNIQMKDGSTTVTKGVMRRAGEMIMVRMERQMPPTLPGQAPVTPPIDEVGVAISKISRIEFPEPPQLKAASALVEQGKLPEAIAQVDAALRFYEGFRDAPGSWWAPLSVLKMGALLGQGNDKEASALAEQFSRSATDLSAVLTGRGMLAVIASRRGDHVRALELFEAVQKDATASSDILALCAIYKGQSHLALKQYDPAVFAFLQIPVFYPDQKQLLAASTLGAGKAYAGLEDRERAKTVLNGLIKDSPTTPEANQAKDEIARIERIEKALADPK